VALCSPSPSRLLTPVVPTRFIWRGPKNNVSSHFFFSTTTHQRLFPPRVPPPTLCCHLKRYIQQAPGTVQSAPADTGTSPLTFIEATSIESTPLALASYLHAALADVSAVTTPITRRNSWMNGAWKPAPARRYYYNKLMGSASRVLPS
jgi:hypothetical protein